MSVAERAKQIYEDELRQQFERDHSGEFLAIEPESKTHFLGDTFTDAALAAKRAHPRRTSFVLRIGHDAAFHMGATGK